MSKNRSRVFGSSLKPAWSKDKISKFLKETEGDIIVYIINHNKDTSENGEIIEEHTHIYLEYVNPRLVSTVANLLEVEPNFIEVIKNKKGYLRYLIHKDDKDKYQYDESEVFTNHSIDYSTMILGNSLSDKEIAEYIVSGRGIELLGVVSASKLRTIQGFVHFDTSHQMLNHIRNLNEKMDYILDGIKKVEDFALTFVSGIKQSSEALTAGMFSIAAELKAVRSKSQRSAHRVK